MADSPAEIFEARREVLLAQLEYLIVEAEALGPLLQDIPIGLLKVEFLGEPSVLGAFADLARRDREVHLHIVLQELGDEQGSRDVEGEADYSAASVPDVLAAVISSRRALLEALSRLDSTGWQAQASVAGKRVSLFELGLHIARTDVEVLRQMADRLRGADLSSRRGRATE